MHRGGSYLDSRSRTQGQTPFLRICGFPYGRTADPKDGGPRYRNPFAGGAHIGLYACAPRTRATSLSPRPIRGRFGLLNGNACYVFWRVNISTSTVETAAAVSGEILPNLRTKSCRSMARSWSSATCPCLPWKVSATRVG